MRATRRDFLKTIVVAAGSVGFAGAVALPEAEAALAVFPQGVASGDPKPDSVVLWTRILDSDNRFGAPGTDLPLRLQVATRRSFAPSTLIVDTQVLAKSKNSRCVRVKITGLAPRRHYWYRFATLDGQARSRVGRTRTAPRPGDDVPVRFAFASCQDFIGRWYNSYLPLLAPENDDLDFLVHLGDFIYETTGDPGFQSTGGPRSIRFDDEGSAIPLGDPAAPFFAARSLWNYRQLHRRYRNDPVLQEVLAKFPLIAIWDDHEFSDDSWQDNGTFFDGRRSEQDLRRLRVAQRAWLEFMPIDDGEGSGTVTDILDTRLRRVFPNTVIWRHLRFGRNVALTLTDYRSFRADHLIAEDAFPAGIAIDLPTLAACYAQIGRELEPDLPELHAYVPFAALPAALQAGLRASVTAAYRQEGFDGDPAAKADAVLIGKNLSVPVLNALLPPEARIPETGLPRGVSFALMGKTALFSEFGSRYGVVQKWYDLYAAVRRADQRAFGEAQQSFVHSALESARDVRWSILASSVSHTSMVLDLSRDRDFDAVPAFQALAQLPGGTAVQQLIRLLQQSPFGTRIKLNADQWDGFPQLREELNRFYRGLGNVVMIAGDIHSSWVTDHSNAHGQLFEFTGPAISSSSFGQLILGAIVASARAIGLPEAQIAQLPQLLPLLIRAFDSFLFDDTPQSPFVTVDQRLRFIDTDRNGVVVVEADRDRLSSTYWLLPAADVLVSYYGDRKSALARFEKRRFEATRSEGLRAL